MKLHIFIEGEQRLHLPALLQHKFAQQFDVGEFAVAGVGVDRSFAARQAFKGAEDVHVLLDIVYRWVGTEVIAILKDIGLSWQRRVDRAPSCAW